ncbi:unnamed protein product [Ixodes pacificus]
MRVTAKSVLRMPYGYEYKEKLGTRHSNLNHGHCGDPCVRTVFCVMYTSNVSPACGPFCSVHLKKGESAKVSGDIRETKLRIPRVVREAHFGSTSSTLVLVKFESTK